QMLDAGAQEIARPPNDPMNRVTFGQQQLAQIRTVLSGNPGDQSPLFLRHGRSMVEPRRTGKMEKPAVRLDAASVGGQTGFLRMNREILIGQFDRLLPLATKWAEKVEA